MIDLGKLPKIELHLHLDGSVRIDTAAEILEQDIDIVKSNMIAPKKCTDLNEYLTKFDYPNIILQSRANLERVSYELALDLLDDGVIYAEVRFAPLKHIKEGLSIEEVINAVLLGFSKVDIKINLILCMMRDMSNSDNLKVIDIAKRYLNRGVCAIDLAGAESLFKTSSFQELFNYANSVEVPFTIHAGEADGISSIKSALDFGTLRIGHGIRLLEDTTLMNLVRDKKILLEICPTSNIQTNVVKSYENHPIKKYYDYGIRISINTDNRTVSNVNLTDEYKNLINNLGFTIQNIIDINKMAISTAFLSNDEKTQLLNEYNSIISCLF